MDSNTIKRIQAAVRKIKIHKRGTPEGKAQRDDFKRRWGVLPEGL